MCCVGKLIVYARGVCMALIALCRRAPSRLGRRDLPHAGAGGGRQRAPRGILHAPDLAGEPLRPEAVSPKGAQGIAQFMPQTAAMRGLANAFEPLQALRESASYLRELRTTFRGNWAWPRRPTMPGPARSKHGSPVAACCRSRRRPMSASSPATPPRPGRRSRRRVRGLDPPAGERCAEIAKA